MNKQDHNHGGKSHLLGMLGIAAAVLIVLLAAGRSFSEALTLAAVLACPLMMVGMMFMMRRGHDHSDHEVTKAPTSPSASSFTHQNH
ncbi:DUF2933 domain-containing protein [Sanguibacter antarcticus]|uniref:DUF2933 family protein n=1 Tax=Sanguibacter antarcticus TaxID=372484 RepID=A0A2A9E2I9_9MICO|nr:DUF2933 domain-containing protein [Sanguibacter antarcticus]PFG32409.1 Protein of unknown function (DUF2933) [Sanguibacter antarcticus]